jgi:hypothetical protein
MRQSCTVGLLAKLQHNRRRRVVLAVSAYMRICCCNSALPCLPALLRPAADEMMRNAGGLNLKPRAHMQAQAWWASLACLLQSECSIVFIGSSGSPVSLTAHKCQGNPSRSSERVRCGVRVYARSSPKFDTQSQSRAALLSAGCLSGDAAGACCA